MLECKTSSYIINSQHEPKHPFSHPPDPSRSIAPTDPTIGFPSSRLEPLEVFHRRRAPRVGDRQGRHRPGRRPNGPNGCGGKTSEVWSTCSRIGRELLPFLESMFGHKKALFYMCSCIVRIFIDSLPFFCRNNRNNIVMWMCLSDFRPLWPNGL